MNETPYMKTARTEVANTQTVLLEDIMNTFEDAFVGAYTHFFETKVETKQSAMAALKETPFVALMWNVRIVSDESGLSYEHTFLIAFPDDERETIDYFPPQGHYIQANWVVLSGHDFSKWAVKQGETK